LRWKVAAKGFLPEAEATGYPMTKPSAMKIMVFAMKRGLSCDAWLPYDNPKLNAFW